MTFEPVTTLKELSTLDEDQMTKGYVAGLNGSSEPEQHLGKSYWHGWRNGMIDSNRMPSDAASAELARQIVEKSKTVNR